MPLPLDRFLRFAELTEVLETLAAAHPDLVALESIGTSYEGRPLWLVTVTDTTVAPHHEKPAHWIDANIHATEVTAGVAALAVLDHLVAGWAADPVVQWALRERTFYVVPRVNPDGVELALADQPRLLRSSTRPWPWRDGHRPPGLRVEDVDGDGRVLQMRLVDPDGAWKPHPQEARLLVPREADDGPGGGPYYRLLEEGTVADHDGWTIPAPRPAEGLDLNRNYPAGWATQVTGSGDYPGSETEIQALLAALTARPNVCIANSFHTSGGVLLRPSSTRSDRDLPPEDVWVWTELGKRGTALTGYPVHSVYEEFTWDRADPMAGASDDWAYEHLGVYAWTTEFWDVVHAATGERLPTTWWVTGPPVEQQLAVLRWADEHHPGELFGEWRRFEHPQLGAVELGGWDAIVGWGNPPPSRVGDEVRPHAAFAVYQALASPCLAVRHRHVERLGDDTWRVEVGLANTGWLPTSVTQRAAKGMTRALPVVAAVTGAEVIGGLRRLELGQLSGRARVRLDGAGSDGTPDRVLAGWVVQAQEGTEVEVTATHPRAGTARTSVVLTS